MTKYWFRKRKGLFSGDLGWGWVPISWEGWLVTLGMVLWVFAIAMSEISKTKLIVRIIMILKKIAKLVMIFIAQNKKLMTGGDYNFKIDTSKAILTPDYFCDCLGEIIFYNPDKIFEGCP